MNLLTAFVLNGKPCLDGHGAGVVAEPIKIEAEPTFGHINVSSIKNWYEEGFDLKYDYIFVRNEILKLTIAEVKTTIKATVSKPPEAPEHEARFLIKEGTGAFEGRNGYIAIFDANIDKQEKVTDSTIVVVDDNGNKWHFYDPEVLAYRDTLDDTEREYLARLYIGDPKDHQKEFDSAIVWRDEYHEKASRARYYRMKRAEVAVENNLKSYQGFVIMMITGLVVPINLTGVEDGEQLFNIDLYRLYIHFGIEGGVENFHPVKNPSGANSIGIMDYIYGRSIFTGKGMIDMPWQPSELPNIKAVCDRLNDILIKGKIFFETN